MARRKDHTREELTQLAIKCGRELVIADGPSALTARNVAKSIGYAPGTLYNLFDNIENLTSEINCVTLNEFADSISEIRTRSKSPAKQLEKICHAYLKMHQDQTGLWTLIFATPNPSLSDTYSQAVHKVFDQVTETIRPLSNNKNTARQEAKIIWSTLHGICLLQQNDKLDVTETDSAETLINRFLKQFLYRS